MSNVVTLRERTRPGRRIGIRGKMLLSIGLILLCGLSAALVAFLGYARVEATFGVITGRAIPAMNQSQMLALQAERLVSLAPLLSSNDDPKARPALSERLRSATVAFGEQLTRIKENGWAGERYDDLEKTSTALLSSLSELDKAVTRRLELEQRRIKLTTDVNLLEKMVRSGLSNYKADLKRQGEDQLDVLRGSQNADELNAAAEILVKSGEESSHADQVNDKVIEVRSWLMTAAGTSDPQQLTVSRSRAGLLLTDIDTLISQLPAEQGNVVREPVSKMKATASANDGMIATRKEELEINNRTRELIAGNGELSNRLSAAVSGLVRMQEQEIEDASDSTAKLLEDSRTMQIIVSVLGVVLSLAVGLFYVGRRVVTRLINLNRAMERIAAGHLDTPITLHGHDEIADMGKSLIVFRDTSRQVEEHRAQTEAERVHAAEERRKAMLAIADNFEASVKRMVEGVSTAASQMHAIAREMTTSAGHTSRQAGSAADAAETASHNVDSAAAAAQQLRASIAEIARRAAEAAEIAGRASDDAKHADDTVRTLDDTVSRIDSVLELINSIAGQTNLLALNATIEAARAGEAGKGFAVVAGEVKHLASQTAGATGQIESQIAAVHKVTSEAVQAIRNIADTVLTIDEIAAAIAAAVEEQDGATAEIARHVTEAADGTNRASADMGRVRSAAETAGRSAEDVLNAAGAMTDEADRLLKQVDRFLAEVRAG